MKLVQGGGQLPRKTQQHTGSAAQRSPQINMITLNLLYTYIVLNLCLSAVPALHYTPLDSVVYSFYSLREYNHFSVPAITNWTGLILIEYDTPPNGKKAPSSLTGAMAQSLGVDAMPPANPSSIGAGPNSQPVLIDRGAGFWAYGGTESSAWNAVLGPVASFDVRVWEKAAEQFDLRVNVSVVQAITIDIDEESPIVAFYSSQVFVFKIRPELDASGEERTDFKEGEILLFSWEGACKLKVLIGYDEMPTTMSGEEILQNGNDHVGGSFYFYVHRPAQTLYFVLMADSDCVTFRLKAQRQDDSVQTVHRDEPFLFTGKSFERKYFVLDASLRSIAVTVHDMPFLKSANVGASPGNFHNDASQFTYQNTEPNTRKDVTHIFVAPGEDQWYLFLYMFEAQEEGYNVTIAQGGFPLSSNSTYTVQRPQRFNCDPYTLMYRYDEFGEILCTRLISLNANAAHFFPAYKGGQAFLDFNVSSPYDLAVCAVRPPWSDPNEAAFLQIQWVWDTLDDHQDLAPFSPPFYNVQNGDTFTVQPGSEGFGARIHVHGSYGPLLRLRWNTELCAWRRIYAAPDDDRGEMAFVNELKSGDALVYGLDPNVYSWSLLGQLELTETRPCEISAHVAPLYVVALNFIPRTEISVKCDDVFDGVGSATCTAVISVEVSFLKKSSNANSESIALQFSSPIKLVRGVAERLPLIDSDEIAEKSLLTTTCEGTDLCVVPRVAAGQLDCDEANAQEDVCLQQYGIVVEFERSDALRVDVSLLEVTLVNEDVLVVRQGSAPRVYSFPADNVITAFDFDVGDNETLDTIYVGAGGYQVVASLALRYSASTWAYSYNDRRFLVLFSDYMAADVTVTRRSTSSDTHLCNPILMCNGQGFCDASHRTEGCTCVQDWGYGFDGDQCSTSYARYTWVLVLAWLTVVLLACVCIAVSFVRLRAKQRNDATDAMPNVHVNGSDGAETTALLASTDVDELDDRIEVHVDPMTLQLRNVSAVRGENTILRDVSLTVTAGSLTLIMGGSGAGKSTLLNVLAGKLKPALGNMFVNGERTATMAAYRTLIGFVPQDDVMHVQLTVREAALHAARMRLPSSTSAQRCALIVDSIIDGLGLAAKRNVIVGDIGDSKLSGGQRKRASVAIEIAALPSVLFCDEPTSGLDSTASLSLMEMLKTKVASRGINVICVIHQPRREILELADNLVLLSHGEVRYCGPTDDASLSRCMGGDEWEKALRHGQNVADLIIDRIDQCEWTAPTVAEMDAVWQGADKDLPRLKPRDVPNAFAQLLLFARRSIVQVQRSVFTLLTLYGLTLISAVVLGAIFIGSRYVGPPLQNEIALCPPPLFERCALNQEDDYTSQGSMIGLALGMAAAAASLGVYGGTERRVLRREAAGGHSIVAYFVGKQLAELPNLVLAPSLFTWVFALMTQPSLSLPSLWLIITGIYFASSGIAQLLSTMMDSARAFIVIVIYVSMMSILGGVNPSLRRLREAFGDALGRALPSISYCRWSTEAYYLSVVFTYKDIYNVDTGLGLLDYAFDELPISLAAPFIIGFVFRVLACIVLCVKKGE